jgi:hypothetical protein
LETFHVADGKNKSGREFPGAFLRMGSRFVLINGAHLIPKMVPRIHSNGARTNLGRSKLELQRFNSSHIQKKLDLSRFDSSHT